MSYLYEIRPFAEHDREAVLALAERLTIGVAAWRDPVAVRAAVSDWILQSLVSRTVLIAATPTEVLGLVTVGTRAHFTGEVDAYIGELVVDAAAERRGVGGRLLRAAEEWATERGHQHLTLETGAANHPARAFYAAHGFAEEDVRLTKKLGVSA